MEHVLFDSGKNFDPLCRTLAKCERYHQTFLSRLTTYYFGNSSILFSNQIEIDDPAILLTQHHSIYFQLLGKLCRIAAIQSISIYVH